MTNYIVIHSISYLFVLGAFGPQNILLKEVRKFFLYLFPNIPYGFAWKLSFQPNMASFMLPPSSCSLLLQNYVFF